VEAQVPVNSAKEIMFSSTFVCLFVSRITPEILHQFSKKINGKVAQYAWAMEETDLVVIRIISFQKI